MDEQEDAKDVQRHSETERPKRTLLINARTVEDFIRAGQIAKRFKEDVKKHGNKPGRNHGIIYTTVDFKNPVYVWYTATQITIHFED